MKNKILMGVTSAVLVGTLAFALNFNNQDDLESKFKIAHAEDGAAENNSQKNPNEEVKEGEEKPKEGFCPSGKQDIPKTSKDYKIEWDKDWNGYACDLGDIRVGRESAKTISESIKENSSSRSNLTYTDSVLLSLPAVPVWVAVHEDEYQVSSHMKKEKKFVTLEPAVPLNQKVPFEEFNGSEEQNKDNGYDDGQGSFEGEEQGAEENNSENE